MISLKYYSKIWPRALLFANLCNIVPYTKPIQDNFPYVYDLFVQEYFFFCFTRINNESESIFELNDGGQSLLSKLKIEDLSKDLVFFYTDPDKKKFLSKINRICKKVDVSEGETFEGVDIDKILEYSIDEFFEMKKRNFKNLSKKFSKLYENDNGLISYDEFKTILNELEEMESPIQKQCFSNEIIKLKAYIYSITSGKNQNDILQKDFNSAVLKFGIDCPFPLIFLTKRLYVLNEKSAKIEEKNNNLEKIKGISKLSKSPTKGEDAILEKSMDKSDNSSFVVEKKNPNYTMINGENSSYFGQHFTILRELKSYCSQFKEAVGKETNTEILMKHFDNISNIIDLACQFLTFPIRF